jgi:hypothetical protein
LASFDVLRKYYERVNGFRYPDAKFRQQRESTTYERVGVPGSAMLMSVMMGAKKYTRIPVPAPCHFRKIPTALGFY